jgi:shikimate kinase
MQLLKSGQARRSRKFFSMMARAISVPSEAEVVSIALSESRGVLALGGGSVMNLETGRRILRENLALKIFLDVGISQAAPRIGFDQDRPMLLVDPRRSLDLPHERATSGTRTFSQTLLFQLIHRRRKKSRRRLLERYAVRNG